MQKLRRKIEARGQGGFTLIELLVVIAILAILAGVVVFAVGNSAKNAKLAACKTERASIITAWEAAYADSLADGSAFTDTSYAAHLPTTQNTLKYFNAPTSAGGATRIGTDPAVADCASIAATEISP